MTPERWEHVRELFGLAVELSPEARDAFLSSACGGDSALRVEVEALISAHERSKEFLASPDYRAASELRAEFERLSRLTGETRDAPTQNGPTHSARADTPAAFGLLQQTRKSLTVALGIALAALVGLAAWVYLRRPPGVEEKAIVQKKEEEAARISAAQKFYKVVPLTDYRGDEFEPAFSPDGKQVAFSWTGKDGGAPGIYVRPIDEGIPLRLTGSSAREHVYANPVWSPDGTRIAYLKHDGRHGAVFIVSALGGMERRVHALEEHGLGFARPGLAWSPDGKHLAFPYSNTLGENYRIMLLDVDTLKERLLTLPPDASSDDALPTFSPDGQQLAFARQVGDGADIYVVPASAGEPRRITFDESMIFGLAWTPDGREIVYAVQGDESRSPQSGNSALRRVSLEGGVAEQLTFGTEDAAFPTFSRDGSVFAFEQVMITQADQQSSDLMLVKDFR